MNNHAVISQILNYCACLFPFLIPGPVAAVVFQAILKKKSVLIMVMFWFMLLVANGIASFLIITTFGHAWPGPGFFTVLATPISASVSLVILLRLREQLWQNLTNAPRWRTLAVIGIILIPALQMLVAIISAGCVDAACRWLYPMGLGC